MLYENDQPLSFEKFRGYHPFKVSLIEGWSSYPFLRVYGLLERYDILGLLMSSR